jgi:hypothetical protein
MKIHATVSQETGKVTHHLKPIEVREYSPEEVDAVLAAHSRGREIRPQQQIIRNEPGCLNGLLRLLRRGTER